MIINDIFNSALDHSTAIKVSVSKENNEYVLNIVSANADNILIQKRKVLNVNNLRGGVDEIINVLTDFRGEEETPTPEKSFTLNKAPEFTLEEEKVTLTPRFGFELVEAFSIGDRVYDEDYDDYYDEECECGCCDCDDWFEDEEDEDDEEETSFLDFIASLTDMLDRFVSEI